MYKNILELDSKIRDILLPEIGEDEEEPELEQKVSEQLSYWFKHQIKRKYEREKYAYELYLVEVMDILKKYEEELFIPVVIDFHRKSSLSTNISKKKTVEFLTGEFNHKVSLFFFKTFSFLNEPCHKKAPPCCIQPLYLLEDNNFFICCNSCGERSELNNVTSNYGDCNRLAISHKNPNDKRNHFSECIDNFQGIQKCDISEDFLKKIEEHLCQFRLIDEQKMTRVEKFSKIKKEHIKYVLKYMGESKTCKEDINIIHKIITAQAFPDVNHLKNKLLDDFDLFDARYNQLFPKTDQSAYHYYLILYQLLSYYNFPCKRSDFNFLKTAERKFLHDQKYKQVFESLGWNYQSLF